MHERREAFRAWAGLRTFSRMISNKSSLGAPAR
jgi:hypothetical protein